MEATILGYTRDSKGKIQNYHLKTLANTIHTSVGAGGNTCQYLFEPAILRQERTEEEKTRRHLHGDSGAKFSSSKVLRPRQDGMSNTLTSVEKDNLLVEQPTALKVHMKDGSIKHARIRKITPTEALRLMDVSEEDIEKMVNSGVSKTQLYKAAGNSICVGVLTALFDKLFVNTGVETEIGKEQTLW